MAKVFLGKIEIPAEEMDNYIQAIGDREEEFGVEPRYVRNSAR